MKKSSNKSGFTLIEIIVVLIIIGILAAIALPNLFSNIPKSKAATALASADAYKTVMEQCFGQNPTYVPGVGGANSCDIVGGTNSLNLATSIQGITLADTGSGTSGAGTLTYTITGTDTAGVLAFSITRATNGVFSCAGNSTPASPYYEIC